MSRMSLSKERLRKSRDFVLRGDVDGDVDVCFISGIKGSSVVQENKKESKNS